MQPSLKGLAKTLSNEGYVRLDRAFFDSPDIQISKSRDVFLKLCSELPVDEFAGVANRRRRYGTFVLLPWSGTLESVPPTWDERRANFVSRYAQGADFNPEQTGHVRVFAPLAPEQAANPFLRWLVQKAFALVAANFEPLPVWVGCHIIRLMATPSIPGKSTPDLVHRDGEPYTMALLLERTGVVGGENIITRPDVEGMHPADIDDGAILTRFTLETPGEGWILSDKKVAHYVSPVAVEPGAAVGHRTVLLLDFTPMTPAFLDRELPALTFGASRT